MQRCTVREMTAGDATEAVGRQTSLDTSSPSKSLPIVCLPSNGMRTTHSSSLRGAMVASSLGCTSWVRSCACRPTAAVGGLVVEAGSRGAGVGRTPMAQVEDWAVGSGYFPVRV
jgi:hypothetical protein